MGGCLSAHSKKQKEQRASNHQVSSVKSTPKACKEAINNPSWAPKSGIGRFIQTEQGTVIRTRQINDEDCQHNQDDHCQHKHDPQDSSRASKDEVWFDSHLWLESDSDDDFRSVYGDSLPGISNSLSHPGSTQGTPRPTFVSLKERMQNLVLDVTMPSGQHSDMMSPAEKKRLGEFLLQTLPAGGGLKSGSEGQHASNASMDKGDEQQENSSQKSCLPRLLPSVSFNDKKAPVSPGVHKAKNTLLRLPFKRRSNDFLDNPVPFVSSIIVERPIAGSQVPFCGSDKASEGSWSIVGPSTFKLRGSSYLRDKIKILASEHAMYEPFGVDVYVSPKKIGHIARYVELPGCSKVGNLPSFLILNIQIPMYPATIFLNEIDGEGLNLVLYHKLSERHSKVPSYFQEMFMKVLNDDVERVRGFTADSVIPFRERLKILGRVVNPEELHLSVAERKVVYTYNEKPVLSRPQHSFYQGENYFEVDLDMHRFSYLARKGVEAFRERLKLCILDLGLTVQGNKPDELPEHVLCCVRINKIDFTTCKQLAVNVSSLAKPGKYDERDASEADADSEPIMNGSSV